MTSTAARQRWGVFSLMVGFFLSFFLSFLSFVCSLLLVEDDSYCFACDRAKKNRRKKTEILLEGKTFFNFLFCPPLPQQLQLVDGSIRREKGKESKSENKPKTAKEVQPRPTSAISSASSALRLSKALCSVQTAPCRVSLTCVGAGLEK